MVSNDCNRLVWENLCGEWRMVGVTFYKLFAWPCEAVHMHSLVLLKFHFPQLSLYFLSFWTIRETVKYLFFSCTPAYVSPLGSCVLFRTTYLWLFNLFSVLSKDAGKADLTVSVKTCNGVPVHFEMQPTPRGYQVRYLPTESGTYSTHISYGGTEVPGWSLFTWKN